jgi:hypothetical protein
MRIGSMLRHAPATARNRAPILEVLRRVLPTSGTVLEIASGTGEHAVFMAKHLPDLIWQPSDIDSAARDSIEAWRSEAALPNLRQPLAIDTTSDDWGIERADAIVCINMVHISPWAATEGLLRGASRRLAGGRTLYLYGPYRIDGRPTAPSNAAFDASLRARNPDWGVRSASDVQRGAESTGFRLAEVIEMPANNFSLVLHRCDPPLPHPADSGIVPT